MVFGSTELGLVSPGDAGTLMSPLIMSCIDDSKASTLVDIWFTLIGKYEDGVGAWAKFTHFGQGFGWTFRQTWHPAAPAESLPEKSLLQCTRIRYRLTYKGREFMWTRDVLWRNRSLLGGAMFICNWCFVFI